MPSSVEPDNSIGITGRLVTLLVGLLIRSITWSLRIRSEGIEVLDELELSSRTAILAFFHGRQFLQAGFFAGRKIGIMTSLSRDGELQASVITGLGYEVARGSASRGGARGLIGLRKLMEKGCHVAFAVDGPRGPIHQVKPGAVYLAKKSGAPVVTVAASARPAKVFSRTWDLYLLPWPFGRGAVIMGDAIYFDDDTSDEAMVRDSHILQEELLRLQQRADEMTGLKNRSQEPGASSQ
jgi:lysophospholipid acyltransferase (LPLAT)-like uncharacterized protein